MKIEQLPHMPAGAASGASLMPDQARHWLASLERAWLSAWPGDAQGAASSTAGSSSQSAAQAPARAHAPEGGKSQSGSFVVSAAPSGGVVSADRFRADAGCNEAAAVALAPAAGTGRAAALPVSHTTGSANRPGGSQLTTTAAAEAPAQAVSPLHAPLFAAAGKADRGRSGSSASSSDAAVDEASSSERGGFSATAEAEPPATTSAIRVATQSTHALLTIRDVHLSTAESSRVAAAIAHELTRQGYTSITTYVNGVARRYVADSLTPADPRAVEAPLSKEQG